MAQIMVIVLSNDVGTRPRQLTARLLLGLYRRHIQDSTAAQFFLEDGNVLCQLRDYLANQSSFFGWLVSWNGTEDGCYKGPNRGIALEERADMLLFLNLSYCSTRKYEYIQGLPYSA